MQFLINALGKCNSQLWFSSCLFYRWLKHELTSFLCWYISIVQEYTFHPKKGTCKALFYKECMHLKINKDFRCQECVLPPYISRLDIFYRKAWKLKKKIHAKSFVSWILAVERHEFVQNNSARLHKYSIRDNRWQS